VFGDFAKAMDEALDFDDETMFAVLMEKEADVASVDDEEHLMILSSIRPTPSKTAQEAKRLRSRLCRRG
jgi:hypothetical protein